MKNYQRRVIEHAALSGNFKPARFFYGIEERVEQALSALAPLCHEVVVEGNILWRMHNAERVQVLRGLVNAPTRLNRLTRKRRPLHDDFFAQVLEMCLRKSDPPSLKDLPRPKPQDVSRMYREAMSATLAAQSVVGTKRRQSLKDFEQALHNATDKQARDARRQVILPGKLCGRKGERKDVFDFLKDKVDDDSRIEFFQNSNSGQAKSLLILGTPGLGKSAFLTDLESRIEAQQPKPWIIKLDFDQMTLLHGDLVAWTEWATRQLGQQIQGVGHQLSQLRSELAAERSGVSNQVELSQADRLLSYTTDVLSDVEPQPLVILIDTIEELVARDMRDLFIERPTATVFYRLIEWVEQISMVNGDQPTHVVYSGRIAPPIANETPGEWFTGQLELSELSDGAATELLSQRDPSMGQATLAGLVKALGGHPLHLIIAQKHINGLEKAERAQVIKDLNDAGLRGLTSDEILQTLYTRFLARMKIRDPQHGITSETIEALAHPGLLMREVTIDILANVIAPAVDIDLTMPERAQEAFRILRDQVWLVNASSDGHSITHRSDVRRVMLPFMLQQNPTDEAIAVLHGAIRHYDEIGAKLNAAYYRSLAGKYKWMLDNPNLAASVYSLAGQDEVEKFDIRVRAHLKYFSASGGTLDRNELANLSDELLLDAQSDIDARLVRGSGSRQPSQAQNFGPESLFGGSDNHSRLQERRATQDRARDRLWADLRNLAADGSAHDILNHRELQHEIETLFIEANFDDVADLGWRALGLIHRWPDLSQPLGLEAAFEDHWLWRLTLASMVSEVPFIESIDRLRYLDFDVYAVLASNLNSGKLSAGLFDLDMLMSTSGAIKTYGAGGWTGDRQYSVQLPNFDRSLGFRGQRIGQQSTAIQRLKKPNSLKQRELPLKSHQFLSPAFEVQQIPSIGIVWDREKNTAKKRSKSATLDTLVQEILRYKRELNNLDVLNDKQKDEMFQRLGSLADQLISSTVWVKGSPSPKERKALDRLARGQSPELHETVAGLLANDVKTAKRRHVIDVVAPRAPFWPKAARTAELRLVESSSGDRTARDAALEIVRFVDLCGLLTPMIDAMVTASDSQAIRNLANLNRVLDRCWTWRGEQTISSNSSQTAHI